MHSCKSPAPEDLDAVLMQEEKHAASCGGQVLAATVPPHSFSFPVMNVMIF